MTTSTKDLRSSSGNHVLQLYGDLAALAENVAAYLAEGADQGDHMIVIATPAHSRAFSRSLSQKGVDVPRLQKDGHLAWLDAEETLSHFMIDGRPEWEPFQESVGRLVQDTILRDAARGTRVYGEMVNLLWMSGKVEAALELEGFWNRLLRQERFRLYCAYGVDFLAPGTPANALIPVLSTHTHLLPVRTSAELGRAVDGAMRETLGPEAVDALLPLIRSSQHVRSVQPGPEATLLWLRAHLPHLADTVVSLSRARYEAACGTA